MRDRIGGIFASAGCFLWQVLTVIVVAFPLIVLKLPALVEWIMFAIAAVATNIFAFEFRAGRFYPKDSIRREYD